MDPVLIKCLIGIACLAVFVKLLKSKPEFGIQYKIKKIGTKNLLLENPETEKTLIVKISLLYEDEDFSSGDMVQLHSIGRVGEKTIQRLKKV